jgi:hypothetical protein
MEYSPSLQGKEASPCMSGNIQTLEEITKELNTKSEAEQIPFITNTLESVNNKIKELGVSLSSTTTRVERNSILNDLSLLNQLAIDLEEFLDFSKPTPGEQITAMRNSMAEKRKVLRS